MTTRHTAYRLGAVLGTVHAIAKGTIGKRLVNLWLGRHIVRKVWWK